MKQQLIDQYMKIFLHNGIEWDHAMDEADLRANEDMRTMNSNELRVYLKQLKAGRLRIGYWHEDKRPTLGMS